MSKPDYNKVVGFRVCVYDYKNDRWKKLRDVEDIDDALNLIKNLIENDEPIKIKKLKLIDTLYVVRHYCMFDGWLDHSGPLSKEEAEKLKEEKNNKLDNGPVYAKNYYDIFPANTSMLRTPESLGR